MNQLSGPDIHQAFVHSYDAQPNAPLVPMAAEWHELSDRSRELYTNMALYLNGRDAERDTEPQQAVLKRKHR